MSQPNELYVIINLKNNQYLTTTWNGRWTPDIEIASKYEGIDAMDKIEELLSAAPGFYEVKTVYTQL